MSENNKLTLIHNGRMAAIANEHLKGIIDKHRVALLAKIKNLARSGKHDVVEYASTVAALNVLDDVQLDIRKQIDAAQQIENGVIRNE
ncbi:MAG: hypothetical protein EBX40_00585 [Gammaproteobacteria bacterium]|nr:hypothetical protein [Gammaproteobacteria bacterium]